MLLNHIYNIFSKFDYLQFAFDQIPIHVKNESFHKVAQCLGELCGENGKAEINDFKNNYQIKLRFNTVESKEQAINVIFGNLCQDNSLCRLTPQQAKGLGVTLRSTQIAALLEFDLNFCEEYEKKVKKVLEKVRECLICLTSLPQDLQDSILVNLSIEDLGGCTQLNRHFSKILNIDGV